MQVEASSALNGVGLVRLMGRSSGFIAMEASLASGARPEMPQLEMLMHPDQLLSRRFSVR